MMNGTRFRNAAWACFLSAVLGAALLPSFTHTQSRSLQIAIPIVSLALYIYFMTAFRALLNARLGYAGADLTIFFLVIAFCGLVASSVLDEFGAAFLPISTLLVVGSSVVAGIFCIVLGIQLLRFMKTLRWLGLAFSILMVLQGFFFATVVWIAIGILVAIPADLVLGLIFYRYARHNHTPVRADAVA
jgi:hypothetical protein